MALKACQSVAFGGACMTASFTCPFLLTHEHLAIALKHNVLGELSCIIEWVCMYI